MFKYLLVLTVAALVIYAAQHPELLGLLDQSPDFKVWVDQTHIPPKDAAFDILNVQSREEKPIIVKRILMNDDAKCVDMGASMTFKADTPVKLGEVHRFALGVHGFNACSPVKVLISTDRGESVYNFN
jgi:hypothetical protein